jgi:hypothetical protein
MDEAPAVGGGENSYTQRVLSDVGKRHPHGGVKDFVNRWFANVHKEKGNAPLFWDNGGKLRMDLLGEGKGGEGDHHLNETPQSYFHNLATDDPHAYNSILTPHLTRLMTDHLMDAGEGKKQFPALYEHTNTTPDAILLHPSEKNQALEIRHHE